MPKPKVIPVQSGIHCIYRPSYYNCCYVVHREGRTTLIDTGMKSDGSDVFHALEHLKIPLDSVKHILLTHWHNDHTAGTQAVQRQTGARVWCHPLERPYMEHHKPATFSSRVADRIPEWGVLVMLKGLLGERCPLPVQVSEGAVDGTMVEGEFEALLSPGHTPGHLAWHDHVSGALFAGDALAVIRGRLRFMARPVTPDLKAARESMIRLLGREYSAICPGHRKPLTQSVQAERQRMLAYLESGAKWPLLG